MLQIEMLMIYSIDNSLIKLIICNKVIILKFLGWWKKIIFSKMNLMKKM